VIGLGVAEAGKPHQSWDFNSDETILNRRFHLLFDIERYTYMSADLA
jgi:hypothetical protein